LNKSFYSKRNENIFFVTGSSILWHRLFRLRRITFIVPNNGERSRTINLAEALSILVASFFSAEKNYSKFY
jgi:hypothetical protein